MSNIDQHTEDWNKFIRENDLDALSRVYSRFYDQLLTYGYKHIPSRPIIEDSIQNVFLSFIKYRKSIGNVKSLKGYITIAFRRQLLLEINKQRNTLQIDHITEEQFEFYKHPDPEIAEEFNKENTYQVIKDCVSRLTNKQQEIMYLRYECEISYEEISSMLNISVRSCHKSVYRAIQAIRADIEQISGNRGNLILFFLNRFAILE